jgi:hypothetical protein
MRTHATSLPGTTVNAIAVDPLNDSELLYWKGMREALEAAGDTDSAIYKRAVSITERRVDPLRVDMASMNIAM